MLSWWFVVKITLFVAGAIVILGTVILTQTGRVPKISGAPMEGVSEEIPASAEKVLDWSNWQRPEGPVRAGIQAGHWKVQEVPEELQNLRNNTGSTGDGKREVDINLEIANRIADILRAEGVETDVLPTTVPPGYLADVFVSIHADGSEDLSKAGFKFAGPRRDFTGKRDLLTELLVKHYSLQTGLAQDPNVTRNMRGYYSFAWWRYEHAIHPMTPAAIAETGFLSNRGDRKTIVDNPDIPARALADGILEFLKTQKLL